MAESSKITEDLILSIKKRIQYAFEAGFDVESARNYNLQTEGMIIALATIEGGFRPDDDEIMVEFRSLMGTADRPERDSVMDDGAESMESFNDRRDVPSLDSIPDHMDDCDWEEDECEDGRDDQYYSGTGELIDDESYTQSLNNSQMPL